MKKSHVLGVTRLRMIINIDNCDININDNSLSLSMNKQRNVKLQIRDRG